MRLCDSLPVYRWDGTLWEDSRRPPSDKDPSIFLSGVLYGLVNGYRFVSVAINTLPDTAASDYHATFTPIEF